MFTWICPQCGREVPPAFNDCPNCHPVEEGRQPQAQPPAREVPPPAPAYTPPPAPVYAPPAAAAPPPPPPPAPAPPPPMQQPYSQAPYSASGMFGQPYSAPPPPAPAVTEQPTYSQQPYAAPGSMFGQQYSAPPPSRGGLPTWLLTLLFTFAFLGLGAGIYWTVGYLKGRGTPTPSITVESPAAKPSAKTSPLQKYIEVSGIRFTEDPKKKLMVKFLIVNHSGAEIGDVAGNVTVWGRTQKSEEEAAGSFTFKTNLGPYEYKELTSPLSTKLKVYELPDWQNVSTDVQITAPTSGGSAELH